MPARMDALTFEKSRACECTGLILQDARLGAFPNPRIELGTGCRVRVVGLESAAHLNGTMGMVLDQHPGSSRWRVRLDTGEGKSIRAANLDCLYRPEWIDAEMDDADTQASETPALTDDVSTSHGRLAMSMGEPGQHISAGIALMGQGKPAEAVARYRAAIERIEEATPLAVMAHTNLAHALQQCNDHTGALISFLQAAELGEAIEGGQGGLWAMNIAEAFRKLINFPQLPRPSWWKDAQLLEMSKQAVATNFPEKRGILIWNMRASVLAGEPALAGAGRTAAQYFEAALAFTKAADLASGRPEESYLRASAKEVLEWAGV